MNNLPDQGAINWLHKFARKNYWRVAAWMDYDDLIQDGYAAYAETLWRYPTAKDAAHIMSLFKLVFRSKVEDLVRANTKQVDDARSDIVEIYDGDSVQILDSFDLQALILKAPQAIKDVLALFTDPKACQELQKPFVKYDDGKRETLNDRFCKLLGKDPNSTDVTSQLRTYFS